MQVLDVSPKLTKLKQQLNAIRPLSPLVMGVLNTTPDSYYAASRVQTLDKLLYLAQDMQENGVDIFDIGGESTRPYAKQVSTDAELARVIPAIEALSARFDISISIDTYKPTVMQAAVQAGAVMINDIFALRKDGALNVAAKLGVPVCLMHMQNTPQTMQEAPCYENVIEEITLFLKQRVDAASSAGIAKENIIIDPGFGFGKTLDHQLLMLKHINNFNNLGYPMLMGISRKILFEKLLGKSAEQRLSATLAATNFAVLNTKISIIRTHDVGPTKDAIAVLKAIAGGK